MTSSFFVFMIYIKNWRTEALNLLNLIFDFFITDVIIVTLIIIRLVRFILNTFYVPTETSRKDNGGKIIVLRKSTWITLCDIKIFRVHTLTKVLLHVFFSCINTALNEWRGDAMKIKKSRKFFKLKERNLFAR